jgi:hypothetical protein
MKRSMPLFRHSIKHCLSQISKTQGIENKEKCSSRFSPDEFQLKLNHFSQNHDAHYCSLFEKKNDHFSDVLLFITTEEQFYILSENKIKMHHYI